MQSDSSSISDTNNDATANKNLTSNDDLWAKDLESLASLVTDENRFNQNDNSKDKPSADLLQKNNLSPINLFNDCTNKSTDNLNEKFVERSAEKLKFKSSSKTKDKIDNMIDDKQNDELNEDDEMNDETCTSDEDHESTKESDEIGAEKNFKAKNSSKKRKKLFERKNIKKLIEERNLDKRVLVARKEEEERINRIIEQQKQLKSEKQNLITTSKRKGEDGTIDIILSSDEDEVEVVESSEDEDVVISYARIQDELDATNSGLHTDDSLNKLNANRRCLINVGHPSNDPDIYLDDYLARIVKPHQIGGIRFLYDCIVENITKLKNSNGIGGCILAHSMGLGKTLQIVAFTELFLRVANKKHVLCIVPMNTIQNWMSEYDQWLPKEENLNITNELTVNKPSTSRERTDMKAENNEHLHLRKGRKFNVYSLAELKTFTQRSDEIRKWRKNGGVLLMGYEIYRLLFVEQETNKKKAKKAYVPDGLSKTEYKKLVYEIKGSLIDPGPDLVICDEGHRIKNCKASISIALKEIKTKRRIILTGYPLQNNLIEYWCMVDFVRPGYLGTKSEFANMFERPISNGQCIDSEDGDRILARKRAHVLHKLLIGFVQRRSFKILFHTLPLKQEFCIYVRMTPLQKNLLLSFFHYLQSIHSSKPLTNNPLYIYSVCYKIWNSPDILARRLLENDLEDYEEITPKRRQKSSNSFNLGIEEEEEELNYDWANQLMEGYQTGVMENSFKLVLLFKIIDETIKLGERILIFSQSLLTLNVIEEFLCQRHIPNDKKRQKFVRSVNYLRLDGSTSALDRKRYIDLFNKDKNFYLFLISTKAGSLGINLTGANRLIVFDISFNPCHDAQAVHRIYRYGQTKKCYIYRFIFDNSLEKRIFDRQITKQGMSNQVVDEINSDVNVSLNEIRSLKDGLADIEEPSIPEFSDDELKRFDDSIMRIICKEYNYCLSQKPLPYESLIAESEETKLSRAEKQIAEWEYNQQVIDMKRQNFRKYDLPPPQETQKGNYQFPFNQDSYNQKTNNQKSFSNQINDIHMKQNSYNLIHTQQQSFNIQPNYNQQTFYHSNFTQPNFNQTNFNQQNFNHPNFNQPSFNQSNFNHNDFNQPNFDQTNYLNSVPSSTIPLNRLDMFENSFNLVPYFQNSTNVNQQVHHSLSETCTSTNLSNNLNVYNMQPEINSTNDTFRHGRSNPTIRNFVIPQNLKIKDDCGTEIALNKNQLVMLIQDSDSLILRTFSGKQVYIRGALVNFFSSSNPPNSINIRPDSPVATPSNDLFTVPEIIDLSDE